MNQTPLTTHLPDTREFKVFEARPGVGVVLMPDAPKYTLVAVSNDFVKTSGMSREQVIGKGHFEVFPKSPDDPNFTGEQNLKDSFAYITQHKVEHHIPVQRYDIPNGDGTFSYRYWKISNAPLLDNKGEVLFIIHTAEDITKQILAEERDEEHKKLQKAYAIIEESQEELKRFKFMADNAQDSFILMREDGSFAYLNQKALDALGYTGEEALNIRVPDVDPTYQDEAFAEVFTRAQKGEILQFETLHRRKDGGIYPVEVNMNGITLNGKPHLFAVARNITERKAADEALQKSESKYRTLFETIDDAFCTVELLYDDDGNPVDLRYLEANPAFAKQTGLSHVTGRLASEIIPTTEMGWIEMWDAAVRKGETVHFENWHQETGRWYKAFASPVGNSNNKQLTIVSSDITERKQQEQQQTFLLRFSDEIRKETNPDAIAYRALHMLYEHLGVDRCYVGVYRIAEDRGDLTHQVGNEKVPILPGGVRLSDFPDAFQVAVEGTLVIDDIAQAEGFSKTDKQNISAMGMQSLVAASLRNGDNNPIWAIVTISASPRNWTPVEVQLIEYVTERTWAAIERAKAEEGLIKSEAELQKRVAERTSELLRLNDELKQSNKNLEAFAYAASHDMKEPIRKIHFYADCLKGRLVHKLEEEDRRYFERLENGAKRMNTLIDDLLIYSYVNKGLSSVEPIDLNQVLSYVLDDLELHIEQKGAKVEVSQLPTITGRPRQLQQLFDNLIGNALKYSKEGVAPAITITTSSIKGRDSGVPAAAVNADNMYHLIEVRDNGIGFDQKDAERIFNVFTRLHSNTEYRGTGVGLSIAQRVVQNHGGYIWAESRPGEGATFKILLPQG